MSNEHKYDRVKLYTKWRMRARKESELSKNNLLKPPPDMLSCTLELRAEGAKAAENWQCRQKKTRAHHENPLKLRSSGADSE